LPAAAAGLVRWVYNTVAANNLLIYPATDDDINDGTTNVHVTQTGKTLGIFVAVDGVTWMAMFT
jgi:aromatic ring-cleaving dioxygenase